MNAIKIEINFYNFLNFVNQNEYVITMLITCTFIKARFPPFLWNCLNIVVNF